MKTLIRPLSRNTCFFVGYLVFALIFSVFCFTISKAEGFLLINRFHSTPLDYFFILFTNLGNGLFIIGIMVLMMLRKKFGWSLQIGISFLVSGIIVHIFKNSFHSPRPLLYFGSNLIHHIYGITRTGYSSFPSGHTTSIFALTTLLCLYIPGRRSGLFFLVIAILTGFSRIYLSQHFPIDVLAGSLIGVLVSLLIYLLIPLRYFEKKFPKNDFGSQSVKLR